MTESGPAKRRSITASLTVTPCAEAIEFYVRAFGAQEIAERMTGPDGLVGHAELRIGDTIIMLGDEWPDGPTRSPSVLGATTVALHIETEDVDALWERALAAGAEVIYPLQMQFYGDRSGRLRDPFGHSWGLGQHVEDVDDAEMARRMAAFYEE